MTGHDTDLGTSMDQLTEPEKSIFKLRPILMNQSRNHRGQSSVL